MCQTMLEVVVQLPLMFWSEMSLYNIRVVDGASYGDEFSQIQLKLNLATLRIYFYVYNRCPLLFCGRLVQVWEM